MDEHQRPVCPRCGAYMQQMECVMCFGVEPNLEQAHRLLDRIMLHWQYGEEDRMLHRDLEV